MSEKKIIKRSVKAVWKKVDRLRADRAKLYGPSDIAASADLLVLHAGALRDLAKQLSSLNAMPPDAVPETSAASKRPRKRKKASQSGDQA
jgi:hypothetical protein